jgi:hypothetical protein
MPKRVSRWRAGAVIAVLLLMGLVIVYLFSLADAQSPDGDGTESTPTTRAPNTESTTTRPPATPVGDGLDEDQYGFAAPQWWHDAYASAAWEAELDALAELGIEWVSIVPTWYQAGVSSTTITPEVDGRTATDESLLLAIAKAHARGLDVTLKPHLDRSEGGYRGGIVPDDIDAWFESYRSFILHYARIAEAEGVGQFVVGTELAGTSGNTERWRRMIADVREIYTGPITYAANWDEFDQVEFWDDLDIIGIDAYFPLAATPTTDVAALTDAWRSIAAQLTELAAEWDRPVLFTEVGYASRRGATVRPWEITPSDVESEEEQAAAYQALVTALADQPWLIGVHWWEWKVDSPHSPAGKLAQEVLREWAASPDG